MRRYVLLHGERHPTELDGETIAAFLTHLADECSASASTQNQAASPLLFLYREVLGKAIDPPHGVVRPRKPRRLPVVLTRGEVDAILAELQGTKRLVAGLLYGSGLRLCDAPASPGEPPATPSTIRSPRTSSRKATTSAPCRSCSGTGA